jgi:GAF domain-containing protein
LLCVPLRREDKLLGMIVCGFSEVRPFLDKQIALLQNFAAQAVIAMENARLINETREALEQQTATAEVLQVINSSPGDLTPVFAAILEKAHSLCGADHGSLTVRDGDRLRAVATYAYSESWAERQREGRPVVDSPVAEALLNGADFVHYPDLAAIDHPLARASVDATGVRTALFVPLRKDGAFLGHISAVRREVRPFTDKQIALLQNFAAQAVIAMENARLLTETREALEQQTATAEVLQVINSSPGILTPVFEAMLDKALALCNAAFGIMLTFDGREFHHGAVRGVPEAFAEYRRQNPPTFGPETSPGRHRRGENIVHFPDIVALGSYKNREPGSEVVDLGGARTLLSVALRNSTDLLGTLAIYRQEVRPFSDKEIALLENFAAQAVIAMENARLLTETREALEQQTATAEILSIINNARGELTAVFDAMLDRALRLCEGAFGTLFTFDGDFFHQAATRNRKVPIDRPFRAGPKSAGGRLLRGEPFVHIADARDDEAYRSGDPSRVRLVDGEGARSYLAVPMRKGEALLGNIAIYRQEVRPFTEKQIALLQSFADQAVIAMENARLLSELRQRTDQVAELNRGLEARVAEQVEELGRVGRLKRFLAPQLAELIVSQGNEKILESHRREIVVVFCDLRGYTAFTETAEPEEVLDFLREYHGALGPLVAQFEGTLDQFSGDGIMVFFNDPVPIPDPAERAVKMAMAMREEASKLIAAWRRHGCELGFGVGIAQGFAGTVEAVVKLEDLGNLELKGLHRPVAAFNVVRGGRPPSPVKFRAITF